MEQNEIKALKKDITKLKAQIKKLTTALEKNEEKISTLQAEKAEIEKEIEAANAELEEKEAAQKRNEYSSALEKLDNATLSMLSKRQAELLAEQILSGKIDALLGESDVDTNINDNE